MKKLLFFVASLVLLFSCTGCNEQKYSLKYSSDQICAIEIVSADSSLNYTVLKVLSETEKNSFIQQLETIAYRQYFIGDPKSISGIALKITYREGDYEMISSSWAEYVKDGDVFYIRRNCDDEAFNELVYDFLN